MEKNNKKVLIISYNRFCLGYNIITSHLKAYLSLNNIDFDDYSYDKYEKHNFEIKDMDQYDYFFINSCIVNTISVDFYKKVIEKIKNKTKNKKNSNFFIIHFVL